MRRNANTIARTVMALLLACAATALADDFELDWWTVDGGGEMWTTGGDFELSGTIGQPDTSTTVMTGGDFELSGGFWAGAVRVVCRGDCNCDGQIDFGDINPFVDALMVPPVYCDGTGDNADINGNGSVGFDDINPFVDLLTNYGALPLACPGPFDD